jgi:hypothetical protein
MKHFITILCSLIFAANVVAQEANKDVTITASGSGATLEDAKQSALRSATEQAFGAFISSKTEVFNDQVVADQMSSVSSGNIKSYEVLNEDQLPDGRWGTTIKAIVSVDKLTSFVQAKGIEIEIKGGLFALNIKQQLLNEQGEVEAVYAMVGLLHEPMQTAFDYTIKSGEPKSTDEESKNWEIPLEVTATCNKNMDFCANYLIKTLRALSLKEEEVLSYNSLNKKVFPVNVDYHGKSETFHLRKERSLMIIKSLIMNWEFYCRLFTVNSGLDTTAGDGKAKIFEFGEWHYDRYGGYGVQWRNALESIDIFFPSSSKQVSVFSSNDKRSLSQIEQMTGYSVIPIGVVSSFINGGYVFFDSKGGGFVMSICDIGILDWDNAKIACDELVLSGYDDWYLPSKDALEMMHKNGIGGLSLETWSGTEYSGCGAWPKTTSYGVELNCNKDYEYFVRPVRTFK